MEYIVVENFGWENVGRVLRFSLEDFCLFFLVKGDVDWEGISCFYFFVIVEI